MKIKVVEYNHKTTAIIYVSKMEKNSPETEVTVEILRKKYDNIAIFTSGRNDIKKLLYSLIHDKF